MDNTTLYVAETNRNGDVEYVWVVSKPGRTARPFDPALHSRYVDDKASFSGADSADIKSWIADHRAQRAAQTTAN